MISSRIILCCYVVACFTAGQSYNFFVAKQYRNGSYFCVTDSFFALSWIPKAETISIASTYIPPGPSNSFDSEITDDNRTKMHFIKSPWVLQESLQSHLNEVVLDERWEKMATTRTVFVNGEGETLNYYNVLKLSSTDFDIPLSIRIEREGHIFLCDGDNPTESNCYWLMLQAFDRNETALRKCRKGYIPEKDGVDPDPPCNLTIRATHPEPVPHYLSNEKWAHFKLKKRGNNLKFYQTDDPYVNFGWVDNGEAIKVTNLIIHSKVVDGFWKIHTLDFMYTRDETAKMKLGPPIPRSDGFLCISMYLAMCSSCKLELSWMVNGRIGHPVTYEREDSGWQSFRFRNKNMEYLEDVHLLVSTISSDPERFWAIDYVRQCHLIEYRQIESSEEVPCQLMSGRDDDVINSKKTNKQPSPVDTQCPLDTLGEFCVKCELLFDSCKQIKSCTKRRCLCSAGYKGENCSHGCEDKTYGHGCQRTCGKCAHLISGTLNEKNCNTVNGTCQNPYCLENYSGPKCDIAPEIIFAKLPEIVKVNYTEATVLVEDFEVENKLSVHLLGYTIEYKRAESPDDKWIRFPLQAFGQKRQFAILRLEPETQYLVRSLIQTESGWQLGFHSKIANFTTSCREISEDNIKIKPRKTSADVALVQLTRLMCKSYTISLSENPKAKSFNNKVDGQEKKRYLDWTEVESLTIFYDLQPYTTYTVQFQRKTQIYKKIFKTSENELVYSKNSNSISMRWRPPYPSTGVLKEYNVAYTFEDTKQTTVTPKPCKLWPEFHCLTLYNLISGVNYVIKISSVNEIPRFDEFFFFDASTQIEPSDPPYDLTVRWTDKNDLQLEWKHPNRTNGDIIYFVILINEKRKKLLVSEETYNLTYYYQINTTNFLPTTQYNISVFAFNSQDGVTTSMTTKSPPDVPTLSKEPDFEKRNYSIRVSISPEPPRGQSDTYHLRVVVTNLQNYDSSILKTVIECNLDANSNSLDIVIGNIQQSSTCTEIGNSPLNPATSYNITIILRNTYQDITRTTIYSHIQTTLGGPLLAVETKLLGLLAFFLLILLTALVYFTYKRIKSKSKRNDLFKENSCESNMEEQINQIPLLPMNREKPKNGESKKENSIRSTVVMSTGFKTYVKKSIENDELKRQHKIILETTSNYELVDCKLQVEYVDMDYISGLQIKNAYIGSKVPNSKELDEFWKIIWNENIQHVVFFEDIHINKGIKNYWPNRNKSLRCGGLTIKCEAWEESACQVFRKFDIRYRNESRQIDQLHLLLHPDDDLYLSSLNYVTFFKKMSNIPQCSKSPILVHSSSGVRGTGFALLCDISLRTAKKDGSIDIMTNLKKLTQYTSEMMIDYDHYVLAHTVIVDTLFHIDTGIKVDSFDHNKPTIVDQGHQTKQLQYLKDTLWLDQVKIVEDNTYGRAIAADQRRHRRVAMYSTNYPDQSSLLKVNGFRTPGKFLVISQQTWKLFDFLKMIFEKNISVIVTLNENIFSWPNKTQPIIDLNGDISIKHKETKKLKAHDWISVEISTRKACLTIEVISFKNWPASTETLPNIADFVQLVSDSNEIFKSTTPVLVTCHDGVKGSGLYVASCYLYQKMKTEGICDVCGCIRAVRRHCEDFVKDAKYYHFLLEAAYHYMKEFNLYEIRC